eukprot:1078160-Prymnesium_polylepis.1
MLRCGRGGGEVDCMPRTGLSLRYRSGVSGVCPPHRHRTTTTTHHHEPRACQHVDNMRNVHVCVFKPSRRWISTDSAQAAAAPALSAGYGVRVRLRLCHTWGGSSALRKKTANSSGRAATWIVV